MRSVPILFMFLISVPLLGQNWKQMSGDDLFALARKTAFDGNTEEARLMLQQVLAEAPAYHEARVFMARTYYWDEQRNKAREQLETVLSQDPENTEALDLRVDVELADGKPETALIFADRGLAITPMSEDLLYKKAVALVQLDRKDEAAVLLARLLAINPSHTKAIALTNEIKASGLKNAISIQYGIDIFSNTYRPANYLSLQLNRTDKWGTGILRVNYANRFSLNGVQGEIDLYPKIANGVYAYLNYGYSNSALFPLHRAGGEIYSKLAGSIEASLGARYLYFENGNRVTMYTASLNVYYKNYFFSFRPFLVPSGAGNAFSSVINARRYFRDGDNYVGVSGGFGFSPDERRIQSANGLSSDAVFELKAQRFWINWQKTYSRNYITLFNIGFVRQELSFSAGDYVWITNISATVRKRY